MQVSVLRQARWAPVALAVALSACGGDEEAAGTNAVAQNRAPTIAGTPATTVSQSASYVFQADADDADSDPLIFGIDARPAWAAFDTATGRLTGTPGAGTAGVYRGIVIWVSDGEAQALLPAFDLTVTAAPPPPNTPPVISGTPPSQVLVGVEYNWVPTANDADGNALTFTIANRPGWATTFNTTTGRLRGTPDAGDVGSYSNIVIGVSDGQATSQLPAFSIVVSAPPNSPPQISGSPQTSALVGSPYTFQPTATDIDGDTLTFTISNPPVWATFTATTGRLQGTPSAGQVGTYSNIVIGVSDGEATVQLPPFSIIVQAIAMGSATLTWTAPTQNEDGTALTDLAAFRIYWGTAQGSYPNSVERSVAFGTTYIVDNLLPGTYYFAAKAVNAAGVESQYSNVASKIINP